MKKLKINGATVKENNGKLKEIDSAVLEVEINNKEKDLGAKPIVKNDEMIV